MNQKNILIIDDEANFTEMVKLNLEETGRFIVKIENNPVRALQTAMAFLPDLVLLDIVMPDFEGPDVIAMFRQEPVLRNIPIIFLTATIRKDEADGNDIFAGRYVFLAKPCPVDDLINAIDQQLM